MRDPVRSRSSLLCQSHSFLVISLFVVGVLYNDDGIWDSFDVYQVEKEVVQCSQQKVPQHHTTVSDIGGGKYANIP